jgi:capsular polysaccharide biosynthesis protein
MSLADQVELFSEAKVVIGPHGAGLTNIMFAPKGAIVIECFGDSYVNGCFWALANICGHRHAFTIASTETLDYDVSLDELDLLLSRVM